MATINLTKGNRAVGLLNEVAELIAQGDDSLELERIFRSLQSLSAEARTRSQSVERSTKRIAKASAAQMLSRKAASARIALLLASV